MMQHLTAITHHRFSLIRVRSPLLTESLLFSLPAGTEMFHFPAFPPTGLYIQPAVTHHNNEQGFPIRTSSDQRPVIGSPRLIADSHVLHRLLVPRHPPCALNNLQTIKEKITENSPHTHTQNRRVHSTASRRCSRPLYSSQTTNHTTTNTREKPPAPAPASHTDHTACSPKTQQRTSMAPPQTRKHDIPPMSKPPIRHSQIAWPTNIVELLRKEVIQPHLPVRLPCYDLVPIANPTFDGSPHKG